MRSLVALIQRAVRERFFKMMPGIGSLMILSGCVYVNQLTMTSKIEKLRIAKPIPLEVRLPITEASGNKIF